jgi:hypothetical protein
MKRQHNQAARRTAWLRTGALLAICASAPGVGAQETRADLLAQERAVKAQETAAAESAGPSWLERTFSWGEAKLENASGTKDGFYPELGGMVPGAGISVGPGYRHRLFGNRAVVAASAAESWHQYTMLRSRLEWPQLFTDHLSIGTELKYQDFTQINFFGIGGDSLKANQTNYRLRDMDALGFATVRPNRWLSIGGRVGVLRSVGIAAGTSSLSPSTGELFDAVTAPGLTRQPGFLHADLSVDVDTQDAAEYIPLLHKNWVLALRGRAVLTETAAGQDVPFYLLPSLGGSTTLRGFLDYRFQDRDLLLFNAEYRWPLFRALDGALFYDAGTVGPSTHALSVRNAHTDYGVGVRLHSTRRTLVRLDVARSNEGYRALFSFTAPFRAASSTVVPYAP